MISSKKIPFDCDISAVVVNYHCAADTLACVSSMLADLPDLEVVVVDNSADSVEAQRLRETLPAPVMLLVNQHNQGFGEGCNRGFTASSGRHVMLLNPDARALPGCLPRLSRALDDHPELGAVSPLQWWEPTGQWMLPPAWLPTGIGMWSIEKAWRSPRAAIRLTNAYRRLALQGWRNHTNAVVTQRALSGGALMVRREAANAAGGLFDPAFFMYYEDSDLCLRLRRSGWRLGLVPEVAALHEWNHSQAKISMMEASKSIYLARHFVGQGSWEQRLARCATEPVRVLPLEHTTLAVLPEYLPVSPAWQDGWLLEISPSPLMIPAIGRCGCGPTAPLPTQLLGRLGGGYVFLRLGLAHANATEFRLYAITAGAEASGQASAKVQ